MLQNVKQYLATKDYACNEMVLNSFVPGPAHYRFNKAERVGNELLNPLVGAIKKYNQSSSHVARLGWVIAGIFASVAALAGFGIKEIGQLANPEAAKRQRCYAMLITTQAKLREHLQSVSDAPLQNDLDVACAAMSNLTKSVSLLIKGVRIASLFNDRILKGKMQATQADLNRLGANGVLGSMAAITNDNTVSKEEQARFNTLKTTFDAWTQGWKELETKYQKNEDPTELIAKLIKMTEDDAETKQEATNLLTEQYKLHVASQGILKAITDYNQFVRT